MKNILIPVDGSEYSMKALEAGKELAKAFDSKVCILSVVTPELRMSSGRGSNMYPSILLEELKEFSEKTLDESKKQFQEMANQVETFSVLGNVADEIVRFADENKIDLVVMGSHGLGALKNRLMTGSVTTRVLHHIDVPVLVIK
jgi:nucleotide-binding universal stress UspA family protein